MLEFIIYVTFHTLVLMTHNSDSAREYIDQKRIMPLAQALTTAVAHEQPADPAAFLLQILKDVKAARDSNGPLYICFNEDDVKAMFTVLDPFEKGTVTREQMQGTLHNFGTDHDLVDIALGDAEGPFSYDDFSKMIQRGIKMTLFPGTELPGTPDAEAPEDEGPAE